MRPRSLTHITLVLCLGICTVWASHASGQREERFTEVERLIEAKEFSKALLLLVEIERDNPDMQDETRELMFKIRAIQARGDALMEKILDALSANDVEKALALINELEALDPKSTAKISSAKKGVVFVVNQNHFFELMDAAAKRLEEKKYAEAISLYLEPLKYHEKTPGFDLHREEFLEAGHGVLAETDVMSRAGEIVSLSESAAAAEKTTVESAAAALTAVKVKLMGDSELKRFENAIAGIRAAADMEASLRVLIAALDRSGDAIAQQNEEKRVDLYIQYIDHLCYGRKDRNEGIIRAIRMMWEDAAVGVSEGALSGIGASFDAGRKLFDSGDYGGASAAFQDIPNRSIAAVASLALRGASFQSDGDTREMGVLLADAVGVQEKAAESRAFITLGRMKTELAGIEPGNATIADYRGLRTALRLKTAEAEAREKEWKELAKAFDAKVKLVPTIAAAQRSAEEMAGRFSSHISEQKLKDLGFAVRIAENDSAEFEPRLKDSALKREFAEDLIYGTTDGQPSSGGVKQPSQALVKLRTEIGNLQYLQEDLAAYSRTWSTDASHVSGSVEMKRLIAAAESISAQVSLEIAVMQEDSRIARERHDTAVELSQLGAQYFNRAVALVKSDPDEARNLIDQSYEAYGKSLQYEEDDTIRRRIGTGGDIALLLAQIETALSARILTDVENLITQGIKLITNGNNIDAYQKFSQADQRWQEKHPGEAYSQVLTYYLDLSRSASSVSGSREIPPTDPSYDVVSSYLNLANQNFQEAEKLIKGGKTAEARKFLESAKQNVDSVLSLFPYNNAARVLDLKIVKITDEKAFPAKLKALMDGFIRDSRSSNPADKRAAYLGLKIIQEFLPKDAALAGIIKALAQEIGIEARPISQTNIAKSAQYFREASTLSNRRRPETWQPALKILDDALALNPNNIDARNLQTTIRKWAVEQKVVPTTTAVLAGYANARDLVNKKDYLSAKSVVDALLSDPNNAEFTPLKDLQARINRALGL